MENAQFTQKYYLDKTDEELDALVAEAAGLTLKYMSGEGGWLDHEGVLVHLATEFKPTSRANYALDLLREVVAEGNIVTFNSADIMTKTNTIIFGGVDKSESMEIPVFADDLNDPNDFEEFRKKWLRGICIFYIMYKNAKRNSE